MCNQSIEGGDETEIVFEEIIANNFLKLMKSPKPHV